MTRILLISPPFDYFPVNRKLDSGLNMNYTRPPIGLCYLGSYVRRRLGKGTEIRLVDGAIVYTREIYRTAAAFRPDVVGISAMTPTINKARELAGVLRETSPGAVFVAGGVHTSVRPEDAFPEFDYAVAGEGEKPFAEISASVAAGRRTPVSVPGAMHRDNIKGFKPPVRMKNLDELPFPARDLLEMNKYFHTYPHKTRNNRFTTMFTSRGCGFNCEFCGNGTVFGHGKRFFSLDYVFGELEEVTGKHGCSLVFFDDDEFLLSRDRVSAICDFMMGNTRGLKWICHGRPEGADLEIMKKMKSAGCVEIQVGVESGSEKMLALMDRSYDTGQVRKFFETTGKAGIKTWATFIIGYPGETPGDSRATLRLALETDPTYASFILLLPFPGSKIFDRLDREGKMLTYDWSRYSWHTDSPVFKHDHITPGRLVALRSLFLRRFYLRPGKLARIAADTISSGGFRETARNFIAWLSLSFRLVRR